MTSISRSSSLCTALALASLATALATAGCATSGEDDSGTPEESSLSYDGPASQFAGGFAPRNAPYGGFGGGSCVATHTPVIFVHGNGVNAGYFAKPTASGAPTVYATLKAAGYNDCELFGVTWLASSEQGASVLQYNYHTGTKAARIRDFINDVKAYTGKSKVTIIAHSMGVTVSLHGITYGNLWSSIDSFINVAGGLRGLSSCIAIGYANPAAPTCGSQNWFDSNTFGFWPDGVAAASNPRTGTSASTGFRNAPAAHPGTRFFTISGGDADEIVGGSQVQFNAASALKAQLNVGIDHITSFTDTGAIMATMLGTSCTGTACCSGYSGSCTAL